MKLIRDGATGLKTLPAFPVVLVTVGQNILTAAAFSFYSFEPPSVMIGIKPARYSFELICKLEEFGINIPTADQLSLTEYCGTVSGRNVNKFEEADITPMESIKIQSSLIRECPVNLECKVVSTIDWEGSHRWFIGRIECAHIAEDYSRDQALMFWLGQYRKVGEVLHGKQRIDF